MSEWQIIEEEFISYTGGTAQLISNGECEIHLWETPKDAQLFCDKLNELHEENKELKQVIKEVLELLEEEVDLFSDKATEHDINAYIELRELDNKDAYYMAVSTKKAIKLLKEMIE